MKNQRKALKLIIIAICLISLCLINLHGLAIPKVPTEDIYVQDYASIITREAREDMLKISRTLKDMTSAELVVVTVENLEGRSIEEYSLNLFRQWGIGDKDRRNGVLLLIASGDREARIEVGYGLEGAINDGKAGAILDEMISYFQRDNYSEGISKAYSLLLNEIAVEYNVDIDQIFQGTKLIEPAALVQPISILNIIKLMVLALFNILVLLFVLSKITGRNLFRLLGLFFRGLGSGSYGGPTYPPYMGGMGRGYGSKPFATGSHRSRSTIGRGRFGGGSSGGGGSSRKW